MVDSVDVSWPQGAYVPGAESGVIIAATSCDGGSLFTQSTFAGDVARARAAGKEVGFYHFNGGSDPYGSADYFWQVIKPYFRPGDLTILDVESSSGGKVPAWSPALGAAFVARLASNRGVSTQAARVGIYGNRTDMRAPGWGALERMGSWLWLAAPGGYPLTSPVGEWSHPTMVQISSDGGVDRNTSALTFAQIAGTTSTAGGNATPIQGDDMPIFNDTQQTIYWPNGFYNSYPPIVYDALKFWSQNGAEKPGTEGTVTREVWAGNDYLIRREAQAVASAVSAVISHIPTSSGTTMPSTDVLQQIAAQAAAQAVAALPKTFTVTAN